MDNRHLRMIKDKEKVVWMCITCKNYKIEHRYTKPEECPCSHPNFVIKGDLIVTKEIGE